MRMPPPARMPPAIVPEVLIRHIRSDDAARLQAFMQALSDESRYFRFMDAIRELPPKLLKYFVEIDFDQDMALLAVIHAGQPDETVIGVARYYGDDDRQGCEFAIAVADAWHQHGIGHRLMDGLFEAALNHGYLHMHGDVMSENTAMLHLMVALGFRVRSSPDDRALRLVEREIVPAAQPDKPGRGKDSHAARAG